MTQGEAAATAGISRRAWCEIELDQRNPSVPTLARVETALGVPEGSLESLRKEVINSDLQRIRDELIAMIHTLTTRDVMEQVRLDIARRRLEALQAEVDMLERAANGQQSEGPTSS